jgi:predicted anti-sigma-YlaC factor YlaD
MMTCEEFSDRVTAYLEGRVPHGERLGMWFHSILCKHCRNYLRQMSELVELMGEVDADEEASMNPEQREQLLEAYRAASGPEDT